MEKKQISYSTYAAEAKASKTKQEKRRKKSTNYRAELAVLMNSGLGWKGRNMVIQQTSTGKQRRPIQSSFWNA